MNTTENSATDFGSRTIVGIPEERAGPLTALVVEQPDKPGVRDAQIDRKLFKVRMADTEGRRTSASLLINKMYSWRGYEVSGPIRAVPNRVTLTASDGDKTVGTISVSFDSEVGLLVDDLFRAEIDPLRAAGHGICEFTKLAVDSAVRSKRVLASLFHIAYIYAARIHGFTDLFIEVNPRHAKFYERMLGFRTAGSERMNLRVNAPAVLMRLEFSYAAAQIATLGGRAQLAGKESSLYPYFFSPAEENGIVGRLGMLG